MQNALKENAVANQATMSSALTANIVSVDAYKIRIVLTLLLKLAEQVVAIVERIMGVTLQLEPANMA